MMTITDGHAAKRVFDKLPETRKELLDRLVHNMDPTDTALLRGRIQMIDELLADYKNLRAKTESGTQ